MIKNEKIDWEKLYEFVYETGNILELEKYSYAFLKKLEKIITFSAANFFLFENGKSEAEDMVLFNINDKALEEYEDYYYKIDDIRIKAFDSPEPVKSSSLMNYRDWKQTEYFNDFLLKYNLYYSCGIDLYFGGQMLGTISLFREENERDFSLKDIIYLELISRQTANQLYKLFEMKKFKNKNRNNKSENLVSKCKNYNITKRELDVIKLIILGKSNSQISEELYISINTVKKHLNHIYNKTQANNRTELTSMILKK